MIITKKSIKNIIVDWYATTDGDEYVMWKVGENEVAGIIEHLPRGDGDRYYCDVIKKDGTSIREFNINSISYDKPVEINDNNMPF